MSLILEALRKSEAERRRGQVPNLHVERPPAAQPARAARPAWPWLALTLTLAILAVVATAWLARGVWPPPSRAVDTSPDAVLSSSPADPATAKPYADNADVGSSNADTAAPVGDIAPRPVDPPRLATAPPPRPAAMATTAAREPAALPPPRVALPAAPTRNANVAAAIVSTPVPPASAVPSSSPTQASAPAIAPAVTPPVPVATAAAVAAPLRLSDLTAAERLELPPLKMSMHMWGPTPSQRFAIIDGARVNEGDRLGEAVVDEITASAVVLAWRGQRVQIPLR